MDANESTIGFRPNV